MRVLGWPGQFFWQLTVTAGEGNATDTYSGGKDIIPLLVLPVLHYSPQTIFICPLFLCGAAPQHERRLLTLLGTGNPKCNFFLYSLAVMSHDHQRCCYFRIFHFHCTSWVVLVIMGFPLAFLILGVQNNVNGSISCLIISFKKI